MTSSLKVIHCDGINTESLGHYMSGLGLLATVAKKWPSIRAAWRDGHLVLVGEELSFGQIRQYFLSEWKPTLYERWWAQAQKRDTKSKSSANVWKERNAHPASEVRVLDAHIVAAYRNRFNPLLGTGGNVGKRDLTKLFQDARRLIARKGADISGWLDWTITGAASVDLPDLSGAGTWFVFANKTYNSGQAWFREGLISPWSVLLAMEGAFLLIGGINRRLGARSRPYAVFPFVSEPCQPPLDGEVGLSKGEFWAPLWEGPATLSEVRELFQRGRAQLGGRAAQAAHEFAVAVRAAGVDIGVTEFVRYELRQTTSAKVYEAIPRQHVKIGPRHTSGGRRPETPGDADLLLELIESRWLDKLPREPRDPKQKGKFSGLRGPVEGAIIDVGAQPENPERWKKLLALLAKTQFQIDHNRNMRERCTPLPMLDPDWFFRAWPAPVPHEIRLAQSIASIGAGTDAPIVVNVFGIARDALGRFHLPKARPQRAVWHFGDPVQLFCDLLHRRLIDVGPMDGVPLLATYPCPQELVSCFLSGDLDLDLTIKWIPSLALINWSDGAPRPRPETSQYPSPDGSLLLHALFRPFFSSEILHVGRELLFPENRGPRAGLARRLLNLLQFGHIDEAVQSVRQGYLAGGRTIILPPIGLNASLARLTASLLIPMWAQDIASAVGRWLEPRRRPL